MALEILIEPNTNAFATQALLDGDYYRLTLRWNMRASRWYLDIAQPDGTMIAAGIAVVTGVPLTQHLRTRTGMPPGVFVCLDSDDSGNDPGKTELGERCKLIYLEAADVAAAEAP